MGIRISHLVGAVSLSSNALHSATGSSLLGTLDAPTLPPFLTNNPLPHGFPWGSRRAGNCNPHADAPHTGITRYYDFTVARGTAAPDGYGQWFKRSYSIYVFIKAHSSYVEKEVLMVNGQFPGPTIEANWGDFIEVVLHNNITSPSEGTELHWHGLLQKETPWYDGVPAVTQCPVVPGSTFTYRFRAEVYGTSWWHAHYSAQYSAGVVGPMIIYGPNHVPYDVDLGPVLLSDHFHRKTADILEDVTSNTTDFTVYVPSADNNMINGKMDFNCSSVTDGHKCTPNAPRSKFRFVSGNTHKLRLINSGGGTGLQRFSIDGHTMEVIANDFVPIKPYTTNVVTLAIGQRSDVLIKAIGTPTDSYWMRSSAASNCSRSTQPHAKAVILYEKADRDSIPQSTSHPISEVNCANDDLSKTVPYYPIRPDPHPTTQVIEIDFKPNGTGHNLFIMNNQTFRANYNDPLLLRAQQGNTTFEPERVVYNFGNSKSIRIVLNNKYVAVHPMHMHGHNMYILSEGDGPWDGKTIVNPNNPQRRDVQQLRRLGHIVIQIDADNPGVWPFHCHIAWHASMGLYINLMERPDDIPKTKLPQVMAQTCTDWDAFTKANVVDQIDSGL